MPNEHDTWLHNTIRERPDWLASYHDLLTTGFEPNMLDIAVYSHIETETLLELLEHLKGSSYEFKFSLESHGFSCSRFH